MKKLFAILALVLGVVSCQNEPEALDVVVGGEQEVMLSVSLPEGTRAASDQGFDLNNLNGYKVRYILEISYNGNLIRDFKITDATTTKFPVRLAPNRDYTFTVWADLVTETEVENWCDADLYYNTEEGLANIELKNWVPNTEARDAWTATQTVTYTSSNKNISLELKRPFAKVRVVATDIAEIRKFGIEPTNAVAEYTASEMYTEFDAVAGAAKGETTGKTLTFNYDDVNTYEGTNGDQLTLFADYVLVPADGNVQFTLSVFDNTKGANALIKTNNFNTTIPVVKNKVTTIKGNVLTDGGDLSVDIENGFDTPDDDIEVISGNKTEEMELTEGTYLFGDVTFNVAEDAAIVVKSGNVVIDLMEAITINAPEGIVVEEGATLTINGLADTRSSNRAGKLVVKATNGSAIGGNVTINNLAGLTAIGKGDHAFGIGGTNAEVTINNTKVDYVAGGYVQPLFVNDTKYGKSEPEGGAAIGGTKVVIENSEIVKAEGGSKAAAIGNSYWNSTEVVINNSQLGDIFGGNASAAIGGSRYSSDKTTHHSVKVTIENSTITNAVGGQFGAGIGSGYDTHCLAGGEGSTAVNDITVKNSTVTAQGGQYAAGIGTGFHVAALSGSIDAASTINATAGAGFYKDTYTHAQNIGYGIVDPAREFANGVVTFTVANETIDTPKMAIADGVAANDNEYAIYNANGLKWFADQVNSFELINANVALVEDIDLSGIEWTPIGMSTNLSNNETFRGTFDGRNHTISGLTVNQPEVAGLFGYVYAATIKNVNIVDANINSNHYAGGVVAWVLNNRGNIQVPFVMENCHVKNSTITSAAIEIDGAWDNGDKVGGLVGYACFGDANYAANAGAKISGCSVENTTIKAYRDFAGLVGYASYVVLENCTTNNITLEQDLTHDYKTPTPTTFGLIIGRNDGGNTVDGDNYIADGLYKNGNAYIVKSAEGLVALSSMTIAGGETVKLGADIDLKGVEFNGLNAFTPESNNTFDGQGYTVSNWTYTGKANDMGFIRNWVGPIKNLTIKNAVLRTGGRSAVIVAQLYGNIENCHVVDCNLQANHWACGLIVGMHNSGNIKDCSATNSHITSTGGTAAITGVLNETDGTRTFTNCTVTGCTIKCTNENAAEPWYAGGAIVGLVNLDYSTIEFNNCQAENNTFKGEFSNDSYYGYSFSPVKINGTSVINTAEELEAAIKAGKNVILGADIAMTKSIAISNANFTLDGNGKTISMTEGAINNIALFDITGGKATFKNVTFDGIQTGAVVRTVGAEFVANNVTAQNCNHTVEQGLFRLFGESTITNSTFKNNICKMVVSFCFDHDTDSMGTCLYTLNIDGCEFAENTCSSTAVCYYANGLAANLNGNKFVTNTLNVSNGATVYLGFKKNCTVTNNLFDGNTVTATSKRSAGGLMVGNAAVVTGNAFVNNTVTVNGATGYGNDVCASPYYAAIDLSGNYWGGGAPVENDDYYKEYNNYEVIINDYLTVNPIN